MNAPEMTSGDLDRADQAGLSLASEKHDPFDRNDFDAVNYLNSLFPDGKGSVSK